MKRFVNTILAIWLALTADMKLFAKAIWMTTGQLLELFAWKMGVLCYDVQPEIWVKYIIEHLFKNNEFLKYSYNEDDYVIGGKAVHIPQVGAKPGTKRNRTKLPATVQIRRDTDILYALDEYTTDPMFIPNADMVELSYNKIASVLGEHYSTIKELVAEWMLYHWRAEGAANIIYTTGGTGATTVDATVGTGTRLKFVKDNLKKARTAMNLLNIPENDRYALMPSNLADQLLDDTDLLKRDSSLELNLKEGVITRLYGFNLMERSSVLIYNADGTPVAKDPDADEADTDNEAVLCWQADQVARALGEVKFFEDIGNPQWYGDIYSALVRMGGRKRRENGAGVVAIVQGTPEAEE